MQNTTTVSYLDCPFLERKRNCKPERKGRRVSHPSEGEKVINWKMKIYNGPETPLSVFAFNLCPGPAIARQVVIRNSPILIPTSHRPSFWCRFFFCVYHVPAHRLRPTPTERDVTQKINATWYPTIIRNEAWRFDYSELFSSYPSRIMTNQAGSSSRTPCHPKWEAGRYPKRPDRHPTSRSSPY